MTTQPTNLPVPSESPRDLKFNAGKIDEFVTSKQREYEDRFGNKHYTVEGLRWVAQQAISAFGYITLKSFQLGAPLPNNELTLPNQVLLDESDGEYYRWDGVFPKQVPADSTPQSTGGVGVGAWVGVGDASLREALASEDGTDLISKGSQSLTDYLNSLFDRVTTAENRLSSNYYKERNLKNLGVANKKLKSIEPLTIVCVGDSITAGYDQTSDDKIPADNGDWATHAPIQYPSQLQSVLRGLTGAVVTVINRGYSGDTAKLSYNRWTTNPNANVAHIMIGLNDSDGVASATFEEYSNYLEMIIRRYIDWGCGVVLHTPTAKQFDNVNQPSNFFGQYAMSLANLYGCPVFNAHEVNQHSLYTGVYSDATHFNAAGYARLGDAVAAFIMAGGWVGQYRNINSLTSIHSGRSGEGIGFFSVGVSLSTSLTGAYLTSGTVGLFPPSQASSMCFSFYLDADIANFYVIGDITDAVVIMSDTYGKGDGVTSRLTTKSLQNRNVFETTRTTIKSGRTSIGRNSLIGCYVGRGWKNFVVQFSGTQTAERFLQGIIIEPVKASEATQTNANKFRKAFDEVYVMQIPQYDLASPASIPTATQLNGDIYLPLPDGLYPYVGATGNYFDSAPVRVTITTFGSSDATANPSGVTELLLSRQTGTTTLKVDKIYGSSANSITPTAAGIGSSAYSENVTTPTGVSKTTFPSGTQQGWLWLTFSSTATAFYRIEVRCASKGGQGTWLA